MSATPPRLEGVHNFRELASYSVDGGSLRPKMVYRSGALELMTDADAGWLRREGRIARVIDLRHVDELQADEPAHPLADCAVHLSLFPANQTQDAIIAELNGLYGPGPTPERYLHYLAVGGRQLARAFAILADEGSYPVLIHCTAGKDRTGVLVALLMNLLGASDDDIAAEYARSNEGTEQLIAYLRQRGRELEGTDEEIRARLATPPGRMLRFLQLLKSRYGSARDYLLAEGVTLAELDSIRRILVTSD